MITEAQIQQQLFGYLTRALSLNEFEDWLVQKSWNMHRDSSDAAQRLVGAIDLRFAEYSDNHLTDDGLERELKGLFVPSAFVVIEDAQPVVPTWITSTASESLFVQLEAA
ncbi:MAG TPA: hypothetical protein VNE82_11280 [Candidatus Binataceae bacterium]|nr:hypothetical protein [Candidatus Binataceae bacterium]